MDFAQKFPSYSSRPHNANVCDPVSYILKLRKPTLLNEQKAEAVPLLDELTDTHIILD